MNISYRLEDLDTENPDFICDLVIRFHQEAFPGADPAFIKESFNYVVNMFNGKHTDFQSLDTEYHDLEHTLQATLCFVRLILTRHHLEIEPKITETDFETGLIAILLHDMGYLKERSDNKGTGAKYTLVHESRSAKHARIFLHNKNWSEDRIVAVENIIQCTGPRSQMETIPFSSEQERILGQAVCTADFIGQMSDPRYVEKLPNLYQEFSEYYEFEKIPDEERPYKNYQDLLKKTPDFWHEFVKERMNNECNHLWQYLKNPTTGKNPYIDQVEQNIKTIKDLVKDAN